MVLRPNPLALSDNCQKSDLLKIPTVQILSQLTQFFVSISGIDVYTPKNNYKRIEQDLQKLPYECIKEP